MPTDLEQPEGNALRDSPAEASATDRPKPAQPSRGWPSRLALLAVPLFLIALFCIIEPSSFARYSTVEAIAVANAPVLLLTLAVTITLRQGDFDLSVSAVMIASAGVAANLVLHGTPFGVALLVVLAMALGIGLLNSLLVVGFGLDSFITTLGTMTAVVGLGYAVTQSSVVVGYSGTILTVARTTVAGYQTEVIVGWVLALILIYLCDWTLAGRQWAFIGGNRTAANLLGLRVRTLRSAGYCITAVLSAIAGVLLAGDIGSVDPSSSSAYLLTPFAAAFLGTTAITIGQFNVIGSVIGVYILGIGQSGLALLGAPPWITDLFDGGTLIVALGFATLLQIRAGRPLHPVVRRLLRRTGPTATTAAPRAAHDGFTPNQSSATNPIEGGTPEHGGS